MKKNIIPFLFTVIVSTNLAIAQSFNSTLTMAEIKKVMTAVADWQIANQDKVKHSPLNWTNATWYLGLSDFSLLIMEKEGGSDEYDKWLIKIFNKSGWQPDIRMYHADDVCICQPYIDLYRRYGRKNMINPTIARTDWIMKNPSKATMYLDYRKGETLERWTWCDALFMAPPVYARLYNMTGDKRYLDFLNEQFKDTYDFLFDKEEHLFCRDANYFDKREANGEKVFWARGNGWVMGGLCEILQELSETEPSRKFYENLFKEMASRIITLQQPDGYWRSSLLDPDSYPSPETSGTGFYVYALAYGINSGLLDKPTYKPAMIKGWNALVRAVEPDGKLGFVQPVGETPKEVKREMTEVYGVGAFLLAGTQIYEMAK